MNNRQKMIVRPREHADKRLMTIEKARKELNRRNRRFGPPRVAEDSPKRARP